MDKLITMIADISDKYPYITNKKNIIEELIEYNKCLVKKYMMLSINEIEKEFSDEEINFYDDFEYKGFISDDIDEDEDEDVDVDVDVDVDDYDDSESDSTVKRMINSANYYEIKRVKKLLFKLENPKLPQYDYMFKNLINPSDIIKETSREIILEQIDDNGEKMKLVIFKTSGEKSNMVIKTYASNILNETKQDPQHKFSLGIDEKLNNYPCLKKVVYDCVHRGESNKTTLYYFYGILQCENLIMSGMFEYFVNSNGTLFHRFFREITNIPENMKVLVKL
jgi:hypothetical protein